MTLSKQEIENILLDLESFDEATCRAGIFKAAKCGDMRAVEPLKSLASSHPNPEIRYLAKKALHYFASQQPSAASAIRPISSGQTQGFSADSPDLLAARLSDPDPGVRASALRGAAAAGNAAIVAVVARMIPNEPHPEVRSLIPAVLLLGGKAQIQAIAKLATEEKDARVRANAYETLEKIKDLTSFATIVRGLQDTDHRVITICIRILAGLGKLNLITVCDQMLQSPSPALRDSAAFCLQNAKYPEAIPLLERALRNDPHESVKTKARKGLERLAGMGHEAAKRALDSLPDKGVASVNQEFAALEELSKGLSRGEEEISSKDVSKRRRATQQIAALGATDAALQPLLLRIKHEDDEVALANLIKAIGKIRNDVAAPVLQEHLSHPSITVKRAAVDALATIGTETSLALLLPLVGDPDHRIVGPVLIALRRKSLVGNRAIERLATHADKDKRRAAVFVISELAIPELSPILEKLSGDPDAATAEMARDAKAMTPGAAPRVSPQMPRSEPAEVQPVPEREEEEEEPAPPPRRPPGDDEDENTSGAPSAFKVRVLQFYVGNFLLWAGILGAFYYFVFFDSTVVVSEGRRVASLPHMAERQNGIVFWLAVAALGGFIGRSGKMSRTARRRRRREEATRGDDVGDDNPTVGIDWTALIRQYVPIAVAFLRKHAKHLPIAATFLRKHAKVVGGIACLVVSIPIFSRLAQRGAADKIPLAPAQEAASTPNTPGNAGTTDTGPHRVKKFKAFPQGPIIRDEPVSQRDNSTEDEGQSTAHPTPAGGTTSHEESRTAGGDSFGDHHGTADDTSPAPSSAQALTPDGFPEWLMGMSPEDFESVCRGRNLDIGERLNLPKGTWIKVNNLTFLNTPSCAIAMFDSNGLFQVLMNVEPAPIVEIVNKLSRKYGRPTVEVQERLQTKIVHHRFLGGAIDAVSTRALAEQKAELSPSGCVLYNRSPTKPAPPDTQTSQVQKPSKSIPPEIALLLPREFKNIQIGLSLEELRSAFSEYSITKQSNSHPPRVHLKEDSLWRSAGFEVPKVEHLAFFEITRLTPMELGNESVNQWKHGAPPRVATALVMDDQVVGFYVEYSFCVLGPSQTGSDQINKHKKIVETIATLGLTGANSSELAGLPCAQQATALDNSLLFAIVMPNTVWLTQKLAAEQAGRTFPEDPECKGIISYQYLYVTRDALTATDSSSGGASESPAPDARSAGPPDQVEIVGQPSLKLGMSLDVFKSIYNDQDIPEDHPDGSIQIGQVDILGQQGSAVATFADGKLSVVHIIYPSEGLHSALDFFTSKYGKPEVCEHASDGKGASQRKTHHRFLGGLIDVVSSETTISGFSGASKGCSIEYRALPEEIQCDAKESPAGRESETGKEPQGGEPGGAKDKAPGRGLPSSIQGIGVGEPVPLQDFSEVTSSSTCTQDGFGWVEMLDQCNAFRLYERDGDATSAPFRGFLRVVSLSGKVQRVCLGMNERILRVK